MYYHLWWRRGRSGQPEHLYTATRLSDVVAWQAEWRSHLAVGVPFVTDDEFYIVLSEYANQPQAPQRIGLIEAKLLSVMRADEARHVLLSELAGSSRRGGAIGGR